VALKRTGCVDRSHKVIDLPLPLYMHAGACSPLVNGFVDDALRRRAVPSVNEHLLHLVNVAFDFCVMSGSVET